MLCVKYDDKVPMGSKIGKAADEDVRGPHCGWALIIGMLMALAANASTPNFIILFADDLGYGDLACYGHPSIRTPNLDRMAAEGVRFTDFYSTGEVCTPSRAALLTGRYPLRSGLCGDKRRVLFGNSAGGLQDDEVTLAEALKARGYATAIIGKWHLGIQPQYNPTRHGFDHFFGLPHSNDMNPATNLPTGASSRLPPKDEWWNVPLYRNTELIEKDTDQNTLTQRYTEEAVAFIRKNRRKPFFLYLPHTFPHVPLFVSKKFRGKSPRGLYGDVVEELDWSVGQVLEALRKEGLDKNTLVFFTSDNGPWLTQKLAGGSAGVLHEGKGSTWEGGMRVPCIGWWPGRIKPGTVERSLACNMDLFATFLRLAGSKIPNDRVIDSVDLAPMLFGSGSRKRDSFFYYRGTQLYAVRKGSFKAHFITRPGYGQEAAKQHDPPLLFNVRHDPAEKINIADQRPEVLAEIVREVEKHRTAMVVGKPQLDE